MYLNFVKSLAEHAVIAYREMTDSGIIGVDIRQQKNPSIDLPIATVIEYQGKTSPISGVFVLGFESLEAAIEVAGYLAAKLGLPKPLTVDADTIDLIGEFMNVVVGRTISEWDRQGTPVVFGPPGALQHATIKDQHGFRNESYELVLKLALSQLTFNVTFSHASVPEPRTEVERNKKVLVVDDSRTFRRAVMGALQRAGYEPDQAENGAQGVQKFQEMRPAVVVMDLVMPEMGGLEAAMAILEIDPQAKIVVLTSSDRMDEIVTAKTLGVIDYLIKPVEEKRLLRTVSSIIK